MLLANIIKNQQSKIQMSLTVAQTPPSISFTCSKTSLCLSISLTTFPAAFNSFRFFRSWLRFAWSRSGRSVEMPIPVPLSLLELNKTFCLSLHLANRAIIPPFFPTPCTFTNAVSVSTMSIFALHMSMTAVSSSPVSAFSPKNKRLYFRWWYSSRSVSSRTCAISCLNSALQSSMSVLIFSSSPFSSSRSSSRVAVTDVLTVSISFIKSSLSPLMAVRSLSSIFWSSTLVRLMVV